MANTTLFFSIKSKLPRMHTVNGTKLAMLGKARTAECSSIHGHLFGNSNLMSPIATPCRGASSAIRVST